MQKKRINFFVFATIVVLSATFIITSILKKPRCATRGLLPKVEAPLKMPAQAPEVTQPKKQRPAPTEQEPPLGNKPLLD